MPLLQYSVLRRTRAKSSRFDCVYVECMSNSEAHADAA